VYDRHTPPALVPEGTQTVFVLVPGLLGFAWEWDEPLATLRGVPGTHLQVFDWSPRSIYSRVIHDFSTRTNALLATLPPSVSEVVIFGHSAGGLITAQGAGRLRVPENVHVRVVNVGVPYAGMHRELADAGADFFHASFVVALGGDLSLYPPPAPRVTVESYETGWPGDPVMEPVRGHRPDDPRIGPSGPRYRAVPGTDHNKYLGMVVRGAVDQLVARRRLPMGGLSSER
jgi:hypothetical protein